MKTLFIIASLALVFASCQKNLNTNRLTTQKVTLETESPAKPISFQTIEEARAFVASLQSVRTQSGQAKSLNGTNGDILLNEEEVNPYDAEDGIYHGGTGGYTTIIRDYTAWSGYAVGFTWNRDPSGAITNVSNWTSDLIGMTLGVSWDHKIAEATVRGNNINFTVTGIQHYNIIVEGIGTLFNQWVFITGTFNTTTGAFTMTEKPK